MLVWLLNLSFALIEISLHSRHGSCIFCVSKFFAESISWSIIASICWGPSLAMTFLSSPQPFCVRTSTYVNDVLAYIDDEAFDSHYQQKKESWIFLMKKLIKMVTFCVATPLWVKCEDETHTLKNENLESFGTLATLDLDCRGQNTSPWSVPYTVGKALKCRCRKWARMSHLDIYNTSYGRKKGRESNW